MALEPPQPSPIAPEPNKAEPNNAVTRAGQPIVLILDQFEQFFVQFQETQRSPFIEALKAWYTSDLPVKILIGIRGDLSDRLVELQKAFANGDVVPFESIRRDV